MSKRVVKGSVKNIHSTVPSDVAFTNRTAILYKRDRNNILHSQKVIASCTLVIYFSVRTAFCVTIDFLVHRYLIVQTDETSHAR